MAQILIVEDEESVAWVLAHFLRKVGHTPIVAPDGRSALRAALAGPDLILLDLMLPDMTGAEILRRWQSEPTTAAIPVIVVTGQPDAAELIGSGAGRRVAAILRKPVVFPEIAAVVEAVLRTPAGWEWLDQQHAAPEEWGRLAYRIITEGSNRLVARLCVRLAADRSPECDVPAEASSWTEIAHLAMREGLLSGDEESRVAVGPTPPGSAQAAPEAARISQAAETPIRGCAPRLVQ